MLEKPRNTSSRPNTFFAVAAIVQTPIALLNLAIASQQQQIIANLGITPGTTSISPNQAQALAQQLIGPLAGSLFVSLLVTVFSVFLQMIVLYAPVSYVVSETYQGR